MRVHFHIHDRPPGRRSVNSGPVLAMICAVAPTLLASSPVVCADAPGLDMLDATRERPLFSPTRRPPQPADKPALAAHTPPPQPPDVVLSAVVIGSELQMAFLKRGKEKAFPITEGAQVDGWAVTLIAPRHIVLENNTRSITLEFPRRGSGATTTTTAAAQQAVSARP